MNRNPKDATRAILARGRRDPVWWISHFVKDDLWGTQRAIAEAVFKHRRVAVKACHSAGKTRVAADIVLAFFYCYPHCKIITTAPTWVGVEKLLWSEIRRGFSMLPPDMGGELLRTELRVRLPVEPGKEEKAWLAMGLSTDASVKFQGHHAPKMLVVLDEAPGVLPEIWEAIDGIRAGGDVHTLAIGNPTIASGPFYDCFDQHRESWQTFTVSAFDTPNLAGLTLEELQSISDKHDPRLAHCPRPYLVTRDWVWERWNEWGKHAHPMWDARVLGNFPPQTPDALISLTWVEQAKLRPLEDKRGRVTVGIDVAGPGDNETVAVARSGPDILLEYATQSPEPHGEILHALRPLKDRIDVVNYDSAGIGWYFYQQLQAAGYRTRGVNVGEASHDPERFKNQKAEYYWGLRERFRDGDVRGPMSEKLSRQLTSIRWETNARGQTFIEEKDKARKRGVESPDRAEALMLAFIQPGAEAVLAANLGTPGRQATDWSEAP